MAKVLILDEKNAGRGLKSMLTNRGHSATIIEKPDSIESLAKQPPIDLWIVEPAIASNQEEHEKLRTIIASAMQNSHIVVCTTTPFESQLFKAYNIQEGVHY